MIKRKDKPATAQELSERQRLTPFQKSLLKEAERTVTVRIDGTSQEATLEEVVIRKLIQVAASGSLHALGHALRSINDAQRLRQALISEEVARGKEVKAKFEQLLAHAVRNGADPVWVVPHPDDIVVTEGVGWSVKGPVNEEELKPIRERVAMRDVFLQQCVLEERMACTVGDRRKDVPAEEAAGSTSLTFVHILNDHLPERFRLSTLDMVLAIDRHHRLTKRELLKAAYKAWAAIGQPKPRGAVLPPIGETRPRIERLARAMNTVLEEIRDGEVQTEREIAERLRALS